MSTARAKHPVLDESQVERQKKAKAWLVSSALEGIFPDVVAQAEMKLLDSGKMTPQQFEAYILAKYQVAE